MRKSLIADKDELRKRFKSKKLKPFNPFKSMYAVNKPESNDVEYLYFQQIKASVKCSSKVLEKCISYVREQQCPMSSGPLAGYMIIKMSLDEIIALHQQQKREALIAKKLKSIHSVKLDKERSLKYEICPNGIPLH